MPNLIEVAAQLIMTPPGVKETAGKNRSLLIDRINAEIGNIMGAPYCAAGVSFCAKRCTGPGEQMFRSGSSQAFKRWADSKHRLFTDPKHLSLCKGALGGWTLKDDPSHGHIFIIHSRYTDAAGQIVQIGTYEFNTSPHTKGRDGEGGYSLRRTVPVDGGHSLWFIDTTELVGGEWWP